MSKRIYSEGHSGVVRQDVSGLFEKISSAEVRIATKHRGALSPKDMLLARAGQVEEEARKLGYEEGLRLGKEAGKQLGLNAGRSEGKKLAAEEFRIATQAQLDQLTNDANEVAKQMIDCMSNWVENAQAKLTDIAVETVTRLIHSELVVNRDAIVSMAASALEEAGVISDCKIRINPFDKSALITHKERLLQANTHLVNIEFVEDEAIIGGCLIDSASGIIDATANNFLDRLNKEAA